MSIGRFEEYNQCDDCGWFTISTPYEKICPACGCKSFSVVIAKEERLEWGRKGIFDLRTKLIKRVEKYKYKRR